MDAAKTRPRDAFLCAMPVVTILCSSPGWGGLEMNTVKLARALQSRGWAVSILAVEGTPFYSHCTEAGLETGAVKKPGSLTAVPRARRVARWMRERDCRVLLMPFRKDIGTASLAKRLYAPGIRAVYQQHMKLGISKRDALHTVRYAALDAWIAPLEYLRKEALEKTRVPARKMHVIPFGIDVAHFADAPMSKAEARAALHLPPDAPLMGVVGRLDPKKGQDFLIQALPVLERVTGTAYHLLIAGGATPGEGAAYERSLHAQVAAAGLGGRVHFRKATKDVRPFLRAVDLFALPSEGETYGMVTLEALASGLRVVGTARDGTAEILGGGRWGGLFAYGDAEDFAEAVRRILAQPPDPAALRAEVARYDAQAADDATAALLAGLGGVDTLRVPVV